MRRRRRRDLVRRRSSTRSTSSARSRSSRSASASRSSTRRSRPRPTASAGARSGSAAARARDGVLRARAVGQRAGRVRARVPRVARARRGGVPRVPARLRARRRDARRGAQKKGFTQRRPARDGPRQQPRQRLLPAAARCSRSPTRAATCAASRRGSSTTTTRCTAKYVNSPESELFKKGDLLYGLDTARQPIAKEDRAVVVEGNTDVIALRQAGLLPVVASMGTALTSAQLRELKRLTNRLFLCFDSDAAGQEATLRGMELAVASRASTCRSSRSRRAPIRPTTRRRSRRSSRGRSAIPCTACGCCTSARATRTRRSPRSATFLASLPGLAGAAGRAAARDRPARPAARDAGGARAGARERTLDRRRLGAAARRGHAARARALAGVAAHPELGSVLAELGPEHFDDPLHRRACAHLLGQEPADGELTPLLAELYALRRRGRASREQTAEQLLLRLRERKLQRELGRTPSDEPTRRPAAGSPKIADGHPRVRVARATIAAPIPGSSIGRASGC